MNEREYHLFIGCKKKDSRKQEETFRVYVKKLLSICERYTPDNDDAQDIVQEGFITIFNKIDSFTWQGSGSFEKWMKRIITNAAINYYNKQKKNIHISIDDLENNLYENEEETVSAHEIENLKPEHLINFNISEEDLLMSIKDIPENFRLVFNMYVIDGYSHKEIAEALNISEKTSTTRLFRARKLIQTNLVQIIKEKSVVYEG